MPGPGTYFVLPSCSALMAASLMCCGVSKSGSPTLKETMSAPSRRFLATRLEMATVAEAVMRDIRGEKPGTDPASGSWLKSRPIARFAAQAWASYFGPLQGRRRMRLPSWAFVAMAVLLAADAVQAQGAEGGP